MLNYFEERKLYDIARAMNEEEALIFLKVFLLEKGMYPTFQKNTTEADIEYMQNPTKNIQPVSIEVSQNIGKMLSHAVTCSKCPFASMYGCAGNHAKASCESTWIRWIETSLRNI